MSGSDSDIKLALEELLSNAEEIMAELKNGFSFHDFWQKAAHKHQDAYIDLLVACRESCRDSKMQPFTLAHLKMGEALSNAADKAGYRYKRSNKPDATSIFGTETTKTTYRKE